MSIKPRMTEAAGRKYVALAGLLVIAGALLCVRPAMAQDVKSYTRATFDQWLAKYKDAKPDFKVGDVLTAKDLERMRPFIFPGYLEQLNFPEFKAPIAAPVDHTPRQDYMACTEKYQSQVKLLPDHTVGNYVCGQPFPNRLHQRGRCGRRLEGGLELRVSVAEIWLLVHGPCHLGPLWRHARYSYMGPASERLAGQRGLDGVRCPAKIPSADVMKLMYGGGGNFQRTLDAFYAQSLLYPSRELAEPHAARARCVELRVQGVHGLLLAL